MSSFKIFLTKNLKKDFEIKVVELLSTSWVTVLHHHNHNNQNNLSTPPCVYNPKAYPFSPLITSSNHHPPLPHHL